MMKERFIKFLLKLAYLGDVQGVASTGHSCHPGCYVGAPLVGALLCHPEECNDEGSQTEILHHFVVQNDRKDSSVFHPSEEQQP